MYIYKYIYIYIYIYILEFSCRYPSTDDRLVAWIVEIKLAVCFLALFTMSAFGSKCQAKVGSGIAVSGPLGRQVSSGMAVSRDLGRLVGPGTSTFGALGRQVRPGMTVVGHPADSGHPAVGVWDRFGQKKH